MLMCLNTYNKHFTSDRFINSTMPSSTSSLARAAVISLGLLLTACAPQRETISCSPPKVPAETVQRLRKQNAIKLSVLIDGTPSMQGYVNSPGSRYAKTLQHIDSASSTGWSDAQRTIKYYRFGTEKTAIDRPTYIRAKLPAFYQGGATLNVSRIDAMLAPPSEESLSIIVTDLYQKDADVRLVQNKLKSQFLEQGYAVGVLAVKSEFKGTVYDVGLSGQTFTYSTQNQKEERYHPFYVLLLGSYGNIQHFYGQMQASGMNQIDHEFVIFSPQMTLQPAMLPAQVKSEDLPQSIRQPTALRDGQLSLRKNKTDPVQFFLVTRKTDATTLDYSLPYDPLQYVLPVKPGAIALDQSFEQYQGKTQGFQAETKTGILQLTDWQVGDSHIQFKAKLQPEATEKGIYKLTVDAKPLELDEPGWWQQWNAEEGKLDGAKTNNLLPFLRGLRLSTTAIMQQQSPILARLCFAFQRK